MAEFDQPGGRKKNPAPNSSSDSHWQEGAAGLLLVAAANETGLLERFEQATATCAAASLRSCLLSSKSRSQLLLTLWLLSVVGLHRTSDLRSYTGDTLGWLTGRERAYGYFHTERFLAHLASNGGAECLTDALGKWTAHLWEETACFYIDGHRKPVYTAHLIPRGLIGRTAHGMRNEMHMLLKRLRRTVQCSCSFWGGTKNTSAFWKRGGLERMLSSSIAAYLKGSRNE